MLRQPIFYLLRFSVHKRLAVCCANKKLGRAFWEKVEDLKKERKPSLQEEGILCPGHEVLVSFMAH